MRRLAKNAAVLLATANLAGCGTETLATNQPPPQEPVSSLGLVTFQLQNDGAVPVYIFHSCVIDLTITQLSNPPHTITLPGGCGVCACGDNPCESECGQCLQAGSEIAPGATESYDWSPVDVSYQSDAGITCSVSRALPPGPFQIIVPVYASQDDADGHVNARMASQTFTLPTSSVTVELGP